MPEAAKKPNGKKRTSLLMQILVLDQVRDKIRLKHLSVRTDRRMWAGSSGLFPLRGEVFEEIGFAGIVGGHGGGTPVDG